MSTITYDSQPSQVSGTTRDLKSNTKNRVRKKNVGKSMNKAKVENKMTPPKPWKSAPMQDTLDEDMIEYDKDEYVLENIPLKSTEYSHIITPT
ncbi:hypothetical protein TNIN_308921 [Trichonephila inaurata madagascariensis]|uniref:Uncharacterized protein n=1 Tax=Trichonephila inaurata madagascariensis TaxID=2747483 RepID=A0A8X6YWV3_9ARAC|nr:hypothetical protein TNIN_308921 [Trichonephila inaurata madagascariensis]